MSVRLDGPVVRPTQCAGTDAEADPSRALSVGRQMRHQISVERNGRRYQVRSVKRGSSLRGARSGGGIETLLLAPLAFAFLALQDRQDRYKVGVLLMPRGTLNLGRQVIYKELLPAGADPKHRVQQLTDDIRAGRFDGASRWSLRPAQ